MPCPVPDPVAAMVAELEVQRDGVRAVHERRYLKSRLHHLGVPVPAIRRVARNHRRRHPSAAPEALLQVAKELWQEPVHERRMCAVELLRLAAGELCVTHLAVVEQLLRESHTWALVDNLAVHVAGPVVERHAEGNTVLDRWATDDDFWLRRAALLALLLPLRRGTGDFARFGRYAEGLLEEKEFFIRKAIGWVLREVSKSEPETVFRWLLPRADRVSGLTLREASRFLSEEQKRSLRQARPGQPRMR